jgi:hypothetical protein
MRFAEFPSSGALETSARQGLSAGKNGRPPRSPLPFPSALKVTDAFGIAAVTDVPRYVASSVHRALACPLASLTLVPALSAPLPGAADHATVTPDVGAPFASTTSTTSGAASAAPIVAC